MEGVGQADTTVEREGQVSVKREEKVILKIRKNRIWRKIEMVYKNLKNCAWVVWLNLWDLSARIYVRFLACTVEKSTFLGGSGASVCMKMSLGQINREEFL